MQGEQLGLPIQGLGIRIPPGPFDFEQAPLLRCSVPSNRIDRDLASAGMAKRAKASVPSIVPHITWWGPGWTLYANTTPGPVVTVNVFLRVPRPA